jgi:hypothetical protein
MAWFFTNFVNILLNKKKTKIIETSKMKAKQIYSLVILHLFLNKNKKLEEKKAIYSFMITLSTELAYWFKMLFDW